VYDISNVPSYSVRGAHAHKELQQVFLALSGSFFLTVTDGNFEDKVLITPQSAGFFLPSGYWRELSNFSEDSICLVLASKHFDENDYIRDMKKFLAWKNQNGN
jgi:dTDP-4-dehydrorhamnose 3,5-epimerase-like enzyme